MYEILSFFFEKTNNCPLCRQDIELLPVVNGLKKLVLNKENKILGIACLDESFAIKPKVVFNAIG